MASETFSTVQSVTYDARTGKYTISGAATGTTETLTDRKKSLTPHTRGITGAGAFNTSDATYVGAVTSGGTVEGYIIQYTRAHGQVDYEYVSNGAALSKNTALTVNHADALTFCFMAGTMIATPDGEAAVETLKAGDVVSLAAGGSAAISWLGRQTVVTRFADPLRAQPIRIRAHALEDGVPSRDLLVSPDHALLVEGLLVQAGALVNGISILHEAEMPETFTYYHVELEDHALIMAENTPAETFIDNAGRMGFDNWAEHPDGRDLAEMDLPRAKSARQVPATIRARLIERGTLLHGGAVRHVA